MSWESGFRLASEFAEKGSDTPIVDHVQDGGQRAVDVWQSQNIG